MSTILDKLHLYDGLLEPQPAPVTHQYSLRIAVYATDGSITEILPIREYTVRDAIEVDGIEFSFTNTVHTTQKHNAARLEKAKLEIFDANDSHINSSPAYSHQLTTSTRHDNTSSVMSIALPPKYVAFPDPF